MKNAIALFSGGKDSMLSIIRAVRMGYQVKQLLFMVPTLPLPNPHLENVHIVRRISDSMGIPIKIVELEEGREQESLAEAIKQTDNTEALVAGDVLLEDHVKWHKKVCELCGLELIEPLYGEDTSNLYRELFKYGIEFTIIGVTPQLPRDLIGTRVHGGNSDHILTLLKAHRSDPIGEYGEYHTLVNNSPLMKIPLNYTLHYTVNKGDYGSYGICNIAP
ncbi:MAG: hypothetical protein F7B60_05890 [Desulfurococcales archaeon]|nr:hypothetical protein [Desulfurococcales archaeon]